MNRRLSSSLFVLALAPLAACGDDGATAKVDAPIVLIDSAPDSGTPPIPDAAPDAPPAVADLACMTTAIPTTTGVANVVMSGTAQTASISGQSNVSGAVLTVKDATGTTIASVTPNNPATTPTAGTFSFTIPTGGNAVDGHLLATKTGLRPSAVYPPNPLVADQGSIPLLMLSDATFNLLKQIGDATEDATTQGSVVVVALDCAGNPIEGATLAVTQNGTAVNDVVRYARPFMGVPAPTASALSTDTTGTVYVIGAPGIAAGTPTTLTFTVGGTALRPHTVGTFPGTMTITVVTP
ncbi:MAG: hypothetical protein NT062_33275 [Proteobacteria bacterium]|nr:hypothetical protein [Pseudomonadota bacterium]